MPQAGRVGMATYCFECHGRFSCARCVARQCEVDEFVESFNLGMLTVIEYRNWRALPSEAAIYFVFDASGAVLYVGQTGNLMARWDANYRAFYHCAASIGFMLTTGETWWRLCLERTLIRKYKAGQLPKAPGPKLGCKRGERKFLREAAQRRCGFISQ